MLVHPLSRSALILISEFAKGLKIIKKTFDYSRGERTEKFECLKEGSFYLIIVTAC